MVKEAGQRQLRCQRVRCSGGLSLGSERAHDATAAGAYVAFLILLFFCPMRAAARSEENRMTPSVGCLRSAKLGLHPRAPAALCSGSSAKALASSRPLRRSWKTASLCGSALRSANASSALTRRSSPLRASACVLKQSDQLHILDLAAALGEVLETTQSQSARAGEYQVNLALSGKVGPCRPACPPQ